MPQRGFNRMFMRVQIYIIVGLLSTMAWVASFDSADFVYHDAQKIGLMPNLHLRHHIHAIL